MCCVRDILGMTSPPPIIVYIHGGFSDIVKKIKPKIEIMADQQKTSPPSQVNVSSNYFQAKQSTHTHTGTDPYLSYLKEGSVTEQAPALTSSLSTTEMCLVCGNIYIYVIRYHSSRMF